MQRLCFAILSGSLAAAAFYALIGSALDIQMFGGEMPPVLGFIISGFVVGLLYSLFFLVPTYILICRFFKKHRGYYVAASVLMYLLLSALYLYFSTESTGEGTYMFSGMPILLFPAGVISAAVFSLAIGKENAKSSSSNI